MKTALTLTVAIVFCSTLVCAAASFTPGNVVVYRVGDGVAALANTGNGVYLDEYATNGTLVQSIPLPSAAGDGNQLVASGTATSEGLLTLSSDGKLLIMTGYRPDPFPYTASLAGTAGTAVNRVIGRVNSAGTLETMALADYATGNNPRSACATDGSSVWMCGGAGGVRYAAWNSATSLQITSNTVVNFRQLNVVDDQLYVSSSSGSGGNTIPLGAVGTGVPTTADQALLALPGLPVLSGNSMYSYFFCDLSGTEPGVDTLYIADDTVDTIRKYCKVSGTWAQYGSVAAVDYRGLAGKVDGTDVALYTATGGSSAAGGGTLAAVTDTSGYQGTLSGTLTTLATAGANTAYRGVAMAPVPEPTVLGMLAAALVLVRRR